MTTPAAIPSYLQPGSQIRHYKGGLYTVMGHCLIEATLKPGILYRAHQGDENVLWMRPLAEFDQTVQTSGGPRLRFQAVPVAPSAA